MSASGDLHRATVAVITTLPESVQTFAREALERDFDPLDVIDVLTDWGHHDEAQEVREMVTAHERWVWGVPA
jgi:propanediol dehydratase large subunit